MYAGIAALQTQNVEIPQTGQCANSDKKMGNLSTISTRDACTTAANSNNNNNKNLSMDEIKELQEQTAGEYTQIARSLARAKASRTTAMINAMRKDEHRRFAIFDKVYKAQDEFLELRKAKAQKTRDYETYRIRSVTVGEADNIWLKFYDDKQSLREKLIAQVNEKITKLHSEYARARTTKLSQTMDNQIQGYLHVARNLGPLPGATPLTEDQIDADLALIKSNGQLPPTPSEEFNLNTLAEYSTASLAQIHEAATMQAPIAHTPAPQPFDPHNTPANNHSLIKLLSPQSTSKPLAINKLLAQDHNQPPESTLLMFEYDHQRPNEKRVGDRDLGPGSYKKHKSTDSREIHALPPMSTISSQQEREWQERKEWMLRREQEEWRANEQRREYEMEMQRRQSQEDNRIASHGQYSPNHQRYAVPSEHANYAGYQIPRVPYNYTQQPQQQQYNNYQYPYLPLHPPHDSPKQGHYYPPQQQSQASQQYPQYPPQPTDYRYSNIPLPQSAYQHPPQSYNFAPQYSR